MASGKGTRRGRRVERDVDPFLTNERVEPRLDEPGLPLLEARLYFIPDDVGFLAQPRAVPGGVGV